MKETKKYDNWMKFLTVSVIVIIVCVFTLTVTNTHIAKGTYGDSCSNYDTVSECPSYCTWDSKKLICTEKGNVTTCDESTQRNLCNSLHRNFDSSKCNCTTCFSNYKENGSGACVARACSEYDTVSECPSTCYWDSKNLECVSEICSNYDTVSECPSTCYWDSKKLECVSQKPDSSDNCDITASTSSVYVSVDKDNVNNSYYTVTVSYTGNGCKNQTMSYSATNSKNLTATSYKITLDSGTTRFNVYPNDPCAVSTATVTLSNGKSVSTSAVSTRTDWVSSTVCEKNPTYTSFQAADAAGANVYYSNFGKCADGVTEAYTTKWVRYGCGGGGGGSGSDPTPTTGYACYLVNHKYVWASSKPSGGTLVSSITTESKCSGCESSYTPDNNNNCVKPSSNSSSNVPVNPKTGTVGIIVAWVIGLAAIVYSLWYFKKSSSIK